MADSKESNIYEQNRIAAAIKRSGFEEQLFYLIKNNHVQGIEHLFHRWQKQQQKTPMYKLKSMIMCCGLCRTSPSPVNLKLFHSQDFFKYDSNMQKFYDVHEYISKSKKKSKMQTNCAIVGVFYLFMVPGIVILPSLFNTEFDMSWSERWFLWGIIGFLSAISLFIVMSIKREAKPDATCLHVAVAHGKLTAIKSLTAVWFARSNVRDKHGLTPLELLERLSGQDPDHRYFHRRLPEQTALQIRKLLEENLEREKHNGTLRERIKSIGVDSMSAENEGARFKKLLSEMKSEVKEESMKEGETKNVDDRNAQPKKKTKKKKVKHQPITPLVPIPRLSSKQPASESSKEKEATRATPEIEDLQGRNKKIIKGGGKKLVVKGGGKKRPAKEVSKSKMPKAPSVPPPRLVEDQDGVDATVIGLEMVDGDDTINK